MTMFFGEQRQPLLEFLRNLTPQVLLLTITLVLWAQIDWTKLEFTWTGLRLAATFWACLSLLLAAFTANLTRFIETAVSGSEGLSIAALRVRQMEAPLSARLQAFLFAVWKHNKRGLLQALVVVCFAYASIIPIVQMAAHTAVQLLRAQ